MQVLMAEHHGMCFGVRDAIDLAMKLTTERPVTILGDLVHNPDVVAALDAAGARRARDPNEVTTETVLVTAHGSSDRMKLQLRGANREVHDATCPLVTRAHLALRKLVAEGYFPVVVGQRDHVEVRGLVGDLDDCVVLLDETDMKDLQSRFIDGRGVRLGIVSQTTQPIEHVRRVVAAVGRRLPEAEVRFIDTVCQPTKDRQDSLRRLVREAEVVVVVGGAESNNSRKLSELARQSGCRAYQVASADDLRAEWFEGVSVVGLTAGTSTPDRTIDEVRRRLEGY
jgi:4-hydroxy-3-methylbut-2-enyl diphosphate reductase